MIIAVTVLVMHHRSRTCVCMHAFMHLSVLFIYMYRSQDEPPGIPAFTGHAHEKHAASISGLASAVAEMAKAIVQQHTPAVAQVTSASASTGVSPSKIANLRSSYLQQMQDLHALFETGALTEAEFLDQKKPIL